MMKYRYYLARHGPIDSLEDAYEFESDIKLDQYRAEERIAQAAADDFYRNKEGYDDEWPLDIYVLTEDGKEIGIFEIAACPVMEFVAKKKS